MGSKRRNDNNQMSKEDYEAQQLRDEMAGENGQDGSEIRSGFARASEEVMKSRRIARVSNRNRFKRSVMGNAGMGSTATAAAEPPSTNIFGSKNAAGLSSGSLPSSTTANPFASTVLVTTSSNDAASTTKPNPFASISFASSSSTNNTTNATASSSLSQPKFSFGASPAQPNSNASKSSNNTVSSFSFAKKEPTKVISTSLGSNPPTNQSNLMSAKADTKLQNEKIQLSEGTLLNLAMLRMAQLEHKANPFADWSEWEQKYVDKAKNVQKEEEKNKAHVSASSSGDIGIGGTSTPTTTTSSPFTFSPSTSTTNKSSTFTFAPASSTALTQVPTTTINTSTNSDDNRTQNTTNPEEDPEKIAKIVNEDDEELYECKAKYRKYIEKDQSWKSFSAGTLRLTKSKTTKKTQLVIRNDSGKVQFNIRVSEGMKFIGSEDKKKKKGNLLFVAVQDATVGAEKFIITVKLGDHGGLMTQLKLVTG